MKIGFCSRVCPEWNLATILCKAGEVGFEGVELHGLAGEPYLPRVAELAGDAQATRMRFTEANVELVCLSSTAKLVTRDRAEAARSRFELEEYIELASALACPYVRISAGSVQRGESRQGSLARLAGELSRMATFAAERRVGILVENSADFPGSADLWYLMDSLSHPAVQACWNPLTARLAGERPTISIPRLGTRIGLFHVSDGRFDEDGVLTDFTTPGSGDVELVRAIELLRGVVYRDYLVFDWPGSSRISTPAGEILPQVREFLRRQIDAQQEILTAYKGDKNAPRMGMPSTRPIARPV